MLFQKNRSVCVLGSVLLAAALTACGGKGDDDVVVKTEEKTISLAANQFLELTSPAKKTYTATVNTTGGAVSVKWGNSANCPAVPETITSYQKKCQLEKDGTFVITNNGSAAVTVAYSLQADNN
jgi:hypothetical protein